MVQQAGGAGRRVDVRWTSIGRRLDVHQTSTDLIGRRLVRMKPSLTRVPHVGCATVCVGSESNADSERCRQLRPLTRGNADEDYSPTEGLLVLP